MTTETPYHYTVAFAIKVALAINGNPAALAELSEYADALPEPDRTEALMALSDLHPAYRQDQ